MLLFACGKNKQNASSAINSIDGHEVEVFPAPSAIDSKFIFSAEAAKGATIYYSLRPFESIDEALAYNGEIVFVPPVTIYIRSLLDKKLGPQKEFAYQRRTQSGEANVTGRSGRTFGTGLPTKFFGEAKGTEFDPNEKSTTKFKAPVIDGNLNEWQKTSRSVVLDAKGDLPNSLAPTDIVALFADEDELYFYFAIETLGKPEVDASVAYGVDIGLSNISFDSFGPGVDFLYRFEYRDNSLTLYDRNEPGKDPVKIIMDAKQYLVAQGSGIELRVAKSLLPKLNNKQNLAAQALAGEVVNKKYLVDYSPTLYLRSEFGLNRLSLSLPDKREARIEFYVAPKFLKLDVVSSILGMAKAFLSDIEMFHRIPFFEQASIPVFYSHSDENGFSGLNASDRGVLTTRVVSSPTIEQAHVLIHEFAHFQNAISSRIDQLWLREGFSDWVSENILYKYFPAKTVYEYMRRIRYDNYFSYNQAKRQAFTLDKWEIDSQNPGYEKSLMFMNILAQEVGYDLMLDALQVGLNYPLDSKFLQSYLEFRSGKDLQPVFDRWVYKTQNDQFAMLNFQDDDNDGLMNFDEILLGSNPDVKDSDGDGYLDGEEVFRGRDVKVSQIHFADIPKEQATIMVGKDEPRPSHLLRLVPVERGTEIAYGLLPYTSSQKLTYTAPRLLRAPYVVYAGASAGQQVELERNLYNLDGNMMPISYPSQGILPTSPFTAYQYTADLQLGGGVRQDFMADIPADYSSYDLVDLKVSQNETQTTFELFTAAKPDPFNMYGRYDIKLRSVEWREGSITNSLDYILRVDRSLLSLIKLRNGATIASDYYPFESKLQFLNDRIRIAINNELLSAWTGNAMEKTVCAESVVSINPENILKDFLDCFVTGGTDFNFSNVVIPSLLGMDDHVFELFTKGPTVTEETVAHLQKLGGSAIRHFSQFLGSPLFDRHTWVMHYVENSSDVTELLADKDVGAYLNIKAGTDASMRDFLFIQQLARLYMRHLPNNIGSSTFWTQEVMAQWLTISALHKILPTAAARGVYHNWADLYTCGILGTCSSTGAPLQNISGPSALTEVNIGKILAFVGYLDSMVGTEVMSKVFSHFTNTIPTSDNFRNLIFHYAPDKALAINTHWANFVTGHLSVSSATADFKYSLTNPSYYLYEEAYLMGKGAEF